MSKRTQLLRNMKYKNKEGYSILLGKEERDICIEALEKQVGKKPIIINFYDKTDDTYIKISRCSMCKEYVYRGEVYCSKCGQKLDWKVMNK